MGRQKCSAVRLGGKEKTGCNPTLPIFLFNKGENMKVENGVVEAVKRDNKALKIGDSWYSSYRPFSGISSGDVVSFSYKVAGDQGQWKNINGAIELMNKSQGEPSQAPSSGPASQELPPHYMIARGYMNKVQVFPIPMDHPDRAIVRQNSLTNAVALLGHQTSAMIRSDDLSELMSNNEYAQEAIKIAVIFEKYSTGQLEMEEAMKMIGKQNDE